MSVWRIHNVKKWFIVSLTGIALAFVIFIVSLCFLSICQERYYLYFVIFSGVFAFASLYFLLKESLLRFFPYVHKDGTEMDATITYVVSGIIEKANRPLAVIKEKDKKATVALIGMFDRSSLVKLKEGTNVRIYKIKGERLALLLEAKQ